MKVRTVAIAGLTAGALAVTLPLPAGASSPNAKVTSKTCTYGTQTVTSYTHYVNGAEVRYAKPVTVTATRPLSCWTVSYTY